MWGRQSRQTDPEAEYVMKGFRPKRNSQARRPSVRLGAQRTTSPTGISDADALRRRWRHRARHYVAQLPAVILLVGALWLLVTLFSDARFQINEVTIRAVAPEPAGTERGVLAGAQPDVGLRVVRAEEIQQAADIVGTNIFRLNSAETEERLKRQFGCLERVAIDPWLPNQVLVTVQEYETVLVWESGGRSWWVNAQGKILGPVTNATDLVVIHDTLGHAVLGDGDLPEYIVGVPWGLAQEMVKALPAARSFDYTEDEGLILHVTTAQWPVYLGYKGDARAKVGLMQALVGELMAKKINVQYIDLRVEQRPSFMKR